MYRGLFVIILSVMVISLPYATFAQEEDAEYGYGTVVKVNESKKEIVVSEYDYDSDTEINITYSVDPNAKFENVDSMGEIKVGDEIGIDYMEDETGRKIAKVISIYKPEPEFETTEDIPETPDLDIPDIDY